MIGSSTLRTAENTAMRAAKEQFENTMKRGNLDVPFFQ